MPHSVQTQLGKLFEGHVLASFCADYHNVEGTRRAIIRTAANACVPHNTGTGISMKTRKAHVKETVKIVFLCLTNTHTHNVSKR